MVFALKLQKLKIEPEDPIVGLGHAWIAGLRDVVIEDANNGDSEHRDSTKVWFSVETISKGALIM